MTSHSRRNFLKQSLAGFATLAGGLMFPTNAMPTEWSGDKSGYAAYLLEASAEEPARQKDWKPTEDNFLGPFYRERAPFRAKISPPLAEGSVLPISGRVWGYDTRKPLMNVLIDIWHADHSGHYDNNTATEIIPGETFLCRARLITDEAGYYEYETIHPGAYQTGPGVWRPNHIHYFIRHPGYKELITQLYFKGDPHQTADPFIKRSLIIGLENIRTGKLEYERGVFDIVLEPYK